MADYKLIGKDYSTPDLVAKVTGRAKYAEDFRAEGMLFTKLLLSPDAAWAGKESGHASGDGDARGGGDPDGGRSAAGRGAG